MNRGTVIEKPQTKVIKTLNPLESDINVFEMDLIHNLEVTGGKVVFTLEPSSKTLLSLKKAKEDGEVVNKLLREEKIIKIEFEEKE
ncbi:MAG: hypothetical protein ACFFC7_30560 [Candidatus Hermodarchaeota archaeon]